VLVGIAIELILAGLVIYTPPGNTLFGCSPIDAKVWLLLLPFGLLLLLADELRKVFLRRSQAAP